VSTPLIFFIIILATIVCTVLGDHNGKSGICPFFGNPAKFSYGHIFNQIFQMRVQLQCVKLITDKTNAADLSSSLFAILISVSWIQNAIPQILSKTAKQ